jgi:hypothetical protein
MATPRAVDTTHQALVTKGYSLLDRLHAGHGQVLFYGDGRHIVLVHAVEEGRVCTLFRPLCESHNLEDMLAAIPERSRDR